MSLTDWQRAVLNSRNLKAYYVTAPAEQRLVIERTDAEHGMAVYEIVASIERDRRDPIIMRQDEPTTGMFADKKQVLDFLRYVYPGVE